MHSCIYEGLVKHRRYSAVQHRFQYRLFQLYLDLDEVEWLFDKRWLWSANRPSVAWFRRDDHMGDPATPLDQSVRDLVEAETGRRPAGPIRLLTHLRYFGIGMNPVSFYFCRDGSDSRVEAVVAEVNNTPWGERHCYILRNEGSSNTITTAAQKSFHVSPFMPMDMTYRWSVSEPLEDLKVQIENYASDRRVFDAALSLKRRPITSWNLSRALVRFPLMTTRVAAGIYWQAFRLWWKGVEFHAHPRLRPDNSESPSTTAVTATRRFSS